MGNPPLSLLQVLSVRRKRPKFLPLDLDQFLADTMLMEPLELSCYMRLLVHLWMNGSLPQDRRILARIAQVKSEDKHASSIAWSIAQSIAQASGAVMQEREDWIAKRQKAHEKAAKAAKARWDRYRQTKSEKADAPSITPSMLASMPKEGFPHTPFQEPPVSPYGGSTATKNVSVYPPVPQGTWGETKAKEEFMAKPVGIDRVGTAGNREDVTIQNSVAVSTYPPPNSSAGHFKKSVNPEFPVLTTDSRFGQFRDEVFKFWRGQNPEKPKCPWAGAEQKALADLLKGSPDLGFEEFQIILRNRAGSDGVNPLDLPRTWLATAIRYAERPLDRYQKPKRMREY